MNPFEKAAFEVFCADMWQEINRNAEVDVNLMSDEDDQDDGSTTSALWCSGST